MDELNEFEELVSDDQVVELKDRKFTKKGIKNYMLLTVLLPKYFERIPGFNLDETIKNSGLKEFSLADYMMLYDAQETAVSYGDETLGTYAHVLNNGYVDGDNQFDFNKDDYDEAVTAIDVHISYISSQINGKHNRIS